MPQGPVPLRREPEQEPRQVQEAEAVVPPEQGSQPVEEVVEAAVLPGPVPPALGPEAAVGRLAS